MIPQYVTEKINTVGPDGEITMTVMVIFEPPLPVAGIPQSLVQQELQNAVVRIVERALK